MTSGRDLGHTDTGRWQVILVRIGMLMVLLGIASLILPLFGLQPRAMSELPAYSSEHIIAVILLTVGGMACIAVGNKIRKR